MSEGWTTDRVMALAPDASSVKGGQSQAKPKKWVSSGRNGSALWGEVQGSGKKPYQVRVDLEEPAFKCTCPSRKFPCKHALGLLVILAEQADLIPEVDEPPQWVAEWFQSRQQRAEKREQRAQERVRKPVDADAQKKRQSKRALNVAAGVDELDRFLVDLMREGLASARSDGGGCGRVAARMVDAQAPGLARMLHELESSLYTRDDWQGRVLSLVGRLRLLSQAYRRLETLPEPLQDEVRAAVGFTQNQDELLAKEGVSGVWRVLGQVTEDDGRLKAQRSWLADASGRPALLLAFSAGGRPLEPGPVVGTRFEGELVFFPGSLGLRAIIKRKEHLGDVDAVNGVSIAASLDGFADAVSRCPWLDRYPITVEGVVPTLDDSHEPISWRLIDESGDYLPIHAKFASPWLLRAVSGDRPLTVFGEWDGEAFMPLSLWDRQRFTPLSEGGPITAQPSESRMA